MEKEFLSPEEVSAVLGISLSSTYAKVNSGVIPALRLGKGGRLFISKSALLAAMTPVTPPAH